MKDIDLNWIKEELEEWQDGYKHPADKKQHDFFATLINAVDRLVSTERANAAQSDHINQQQDRIGSLEKKNASLGSALGTAERERDELRKTLAATQDGAAEAINHSLQLQSETERRDAAAGDPAGTKLYTAAQPSAPDRNMLRELVDVVWRYATESTSVPATGTADGLIEKVFNISAMSVESRYSDGPVTIPMASFYRDGIEAAASYLDAQREAFDHEHGQHDPDTGAFEFGNVAAQNHSATLAELSEAIRGLHPNTGNSPAIPDGWKLVPIEPTEDMVISGFESKPREGFSDPDDWGAFEAMSGCKQAAHKARLCYAAMLAAAPAPGGDQ